MISVYLSLPSHPCALLTYFHTSLFSSLFSKNKNDCKKTTQIKLHLFVSRHKFLHYYDTLLAPCSLLTVGHTSLPRLCNLLTSRWATKHKWAWIPEPFILCLSLHLPHGKIFLCIGLYIIVWDSLSNNTEVLKLISHRSQAHFLVLSSSILAVILSCVCKVAHLFSTWKKKPYIATKKKSQCLYITEFFKKHFW